jgi:hypothetical protein
MTLEHNLRGTIPSRAFLHAVYERSQVRDVPTHAPPKRHGGIAAWLADFWEAILGREPKRNARA